MLASAYHAIDLSHIEAWCELRDQAKRKNWRHVWDEDLDQPQPSTWGEPLLETTFIIASIVMARGGK